MLVGAAAAGVELDVVVCSTAVGACGRGLQWLAPLALLLDMQRMDLEPNVITCSAAVSACEAQWPRAFGVLAGMLAGGPAPNAVTYNAAASAAAKVGEWAHAMGALREATARGLQLTVVSYGAAIDAYGRAGRWEDAIALLAAMERERLEPSVIAHSSAISACERLGCWEQALALLAGARRAGLEPNVIACNAAAGVCQSAEAWDVAAELLEQLRRQSLRPDPVTLRAVVGACNAGGEWRRALSQAAAGARWQDEGRACWDVLSCSGALSALEQGGAWPGAVALLEDARSSRLRPDAALCNSVASACASAALGRWVQAAALLGAMRRQSLQLDAVGCSAAVSACERGAPWDRTLEVLQGMKADGLGADGLTHGMALSALRKAGRWDGALALLGSLRVALGAAGQPSQVPVLEALRGDAAVLAIAPGLIAAAKPPGLASEAMLASLAARCGASITAVSRLDVPTSGVLVAALGGAGSAAFALASAQFSGRLVSKEYLCLVGGPPLGPAGAGGELVAGLQKVRLGGVRAGKTGSRVCGPPRGLEARTRYEVLGTYRRPSSGERYALLLARPATGRTHQIRVHLASIGRPLAADALYRPGAAWEASWCPRLFLHCRRVFLRDLLGGGFAPVAPLPSDLAVVLDGLQRLEGASTGRYEKKPGPGQQRLRRQ